jgi:hypothetical protein
MESNGASKNTCVLFAKTSRPRPQSREINTPVSESKLCGSHRSFFVAGVGTALCLPRVLRIRSVRPLRHRQQGVTGDSRQVCCDTITMWNKSESFCEKRE